MNSAALQLSPRGYSNWKIVVINAGMRKDFSYHWTAIAT
jgi:hypothetical protein